MEENLGFQGTVAQRLDRQKAMLEKSLMPKLKDLFYTFHSFFTGIYNVLMKKGLIHEDPYKYDQKLSEVVPPVDSQFLESEKTDQLSIRLSQYETILDFLKNYYQFSLDFITLNRVRQLLAFVKYINWTECTVTVNSPTTRALAEYLEKIRKGTDTLSAGLVNDSQNQLEKISRQIVTILKDITVYHRERYKLLLREKVLSQIQIDPTAAMTQRQDVIRSIRRSFALEMGDSPFFPELVEEVLDEDFSPNAEILRTEVLKKIEVKEEQVQKPKEEVSFRQTLLEAVRAITASGFQLEEIVAKLVDDNNLLKSRKLTIWDRIRNMLIRALSHENRTEMYELEYFDIITSATKTEVVNFPRFIEEVTQKAKVFASIGVKASPAYRKLESAPEEQLYSFLNRNLEETQLIFRRCTALDTFFKSEVPREDRSRLRGIKLELSGLKNCIVKANQKKHEYIAKQEEREQMKKLGINPNLPA